jgi:alkylation response protein AidB-like acyl-CoA dehydrogenase
MALRDTCRTFVERFLLPQHVARTSRARAWADARGSKTWAGSNEIIKELIGP